MNSQNTDLSTVLLGSIALVVGLVATAVPKTAFAAPDSPFVGATGGVWDPRGNNVIPEVLQSSTSGPVRVETGSLPTAYGDFRSQFGSNRFAIQVNGGDNLEVFGGSGWSDGLTMTGNGQGGSLTMSTHLSGLVSGLGEMGYALFVSALPYDLVSVISTVNANRSGFWALAFPNSVRVMFTGVSNGCGATNWSRQCGHVPFESFQGALDVTLSENVPFAHGQTLYVLSLFSGGVGHLGGIESFLNSADFGVSAPPGTTLQSLSGTAYAAAVPEPSSWLLLMVGLIVASTRARRIVEAQAVIVDHLSDDTPRRR